MVSMNRRIISYCVFYLIVIEINALPKTKNDLLLSKLVKNNVRSPEASIESSVTTETKIRIKRNPSVHFKNMINQLRAVKRKGLDPFDDIIGQLRGAVNNRNQHDYENILEQQWNSKNFPFKEVIGRIEADRNRSPLKLPAFIKAEIHSSHVKEAKKRNRPIPTHVYDYLDLVGRYIGTINNDPDADDAGHLLAHSLGGTSDDHFNFSPMTARLNRNPETNAYSQWLGEEMAMAKFLAVPNRRIEWELIIRYIEPKPSNNQYALRPFAFCLRHTNYNELNQVVDNNNRMINNSPTIMCFSNDRHDDCLYDEP